MPSKQKKSKEAAEYLSGILREAVQTGSDKVELERVPDGLEICFTKAGSGIALMLSDPDLEEALFDLIVQRSGVKKRATGKMEWKVLGKTRSIQVKEYNSFGETCFRLKFTGGADGGS
jgi:hypothetical protein